MKAIILLSIFLSLFSCKLIFNNNKVEKIKIWVTSIKQIDDAGQSNYKVQYTEKPELLKWELLPQKIEKFNPEFGFLYQIEVKKIVSEVKDGENIKTVTRYKFHKEIVKKIETSLKLNDIWVLYSINNKTLNRNQVQPRLEINLSDNKLIGNAFCNPISGRVDALNNEIKFEKIICSRMACKDLNLEGEYLKILEDKLFYKFGKNELILYNSITNKELRFKKID